MTIRPSDQRSAPSSAPWRRWLVALGVVLVTAGCGIQAPRDTPAASTPTAPTATTPGASLQPSGGTSTLQPSLTPPSVPPASAFPTETFLYSDILKVQVDRLAARVQPKRSSALVHLYDTTGESPLDRGEVRLKKGDYVSVQLGPIRVGATVWYLVWPATGTTLHGAGAGWYTGSPADVSPGPAWVAASVDADVYLTFHRRPDVEEIEAFEPLGLNAAGTGPFESAAQPRHDGWLLHWAAAAPDSGSSCSFRVTLAPSDAAVAAREPLDTSTSGVKVSPIQGTFVSAPWLPAAPGSWETFTLQVAGTCRWAVRLTPLHHD